MEKQFSSAFSSVFCSITKPHRNLEILAGFVHTGKRLHLLQRADSIDRHKRQGADTDKELTLGNTVTRVLQKSHLKTIHLDMLMSTEEENITLVLGRKQAKPEVSSKGACTSSSVLYLSGICTQVLSLDAFTRLLVRGDPRKLPHCSGWHQPTLRAEHKHSCTALSYHHEYPGRFKGGPLGL